jgi:uncharacterized SAM-binding protein YcdF (DUF218 family)
MASVAQLKEQMIAPLQGAMLGALIFAAAWMIGLPSALGLDRLLAIPVVILLGALLGRWFVRQLAWFGAALCIVVAIGIWSPIVPALAEPFVRNDALNIADVDAVFVFSNGVTSRGMISGEGIDRLLSGMAVRARRPELPLILSAVKSNARGPGISSVADQRNVVALAPASGPTEWIDSVSSTREEAVKLTRRAFLARWKRVAVVTSPMHSRRACATVEAMGLAVTCVVAPWRVAGWPARTGADRLVIMQRLTYEALAWIEYRATGWAHWS